MDIQIRDCRQPKPCTPTNLENTEILLCQLSKVDSLIGLEVERELAPVPLVFRVDDLHRQTALSDLFAAYHHCVVFIFQFLHHSSDVSKL